VLNLKLGKERAERKREEDVAVEEGKIEEPLPQAEGFS